MPTTLDWRTIALRLLLTVIAGSLIGFNRGEHGRAAGLRTTLLVCLAAAIAMIQANLLMDTRGKVADSFVVLDLMRLPLGILSGIGFIGAGAILRKENIVLGVTTAATLWFVTVMGLCFGGGQLGLGVAALVLALIVLEALQWVDRRMPQNRIAYLVLDLSKEGPDDQAIRARIEAAGFFIATLSLVQEVATGSRRLGAEVRWREITSEAKLPLMLGEFSRSPGVVKLEWKY
jgi:putative Mg2+ transporter-C (MgtC) family protein